MRKGVTRGGGQKYRCLNAACPRLFFRDAYATPSYPTRAAYMAAYRTLQRLAVIAPHVRCRQIGLCIVCCGDWQEVAKALPHRAAIVTDPPYDADYDVTQPRRRDSQWDANYEGTDQPFDPTPWLQFPEVILLGADHYWDHLPSGGSVWWWNKTPGRKRAHFAPGEWVWLSKAGPPQDYQQLWIGQQRAGEENYVHLKRKLHPHQKPIRLMTMLVQETTAPVVIDPFMGSGTTLAACVRLGRPCIGIDIHPGSFETACARLEKELQRRARRSLLAPRKPAALVQTAGV
jgi:hypothetical protein